MLCCCSVCHRFGFLKHWGGSRQEKLHAGSHQDHRGKHPWGTQKDLAFVAGTGRQRSDRKKPLLLSFILFPAGVFKPKQQQTVQARWSRWPHRQSAKSEDSQSLTQRGTGVLLLIIIIALRVALFLFFVFFFFKKLFLCVLQIRSERELDKLKGLRLVELSLQRNPLCDHFSDQADYIRSVLLLTCSDERRGKGWMGVFLMSGHSRVSVYVHVCVHHTHLLPGGQWTLSGWAKRKQRRLV